MEPGRLLDPVDRGLEIKIREALARLRGIIGGHSPMFPVSLTEAENGESPIII